MLNNTNIRFIYVALFCAMFFALATFFLSPEVFAEPSEPSSSEAKNSLQAVSTRAESEKKDSTILTGAKTETSHIVKSKMPWNFQKPLRVGVVFILNSLTKINESQGNYEASIDIQLSWHDPNVAFDPKATGIERMVYNMDDASNKLNTIWNPDIVIANMNEKPISFQPSLIIFSDGNVEYIQRIKGLFETPYKLAAFPFDAQSLVVRLISYSYDVSLLQFTQSQEEINHSGIREGASINGWNLKDVDYFFTNIRGLNGNYFSQFEADVVITRKPLSHLFYLAPLFLIVIVPSIITFFSHADVSTRLNNWAGSMLALIALSFTLTLRYPALPSDGILAQLIAIVFGYQFIMICLCKTILDPEVHAKAKNPYLLPELVDYMRWSIPLFLIILIVTRILLTSLAS